MRQILVMFLIPLHIRFPSFDRRQSRKWVTRTKLRLCVFQTRLQINPFFPALPGDLMQGCLCPRGPCGGIYSSSGARMKLAFHKPCFTSPLTAFVASRLSSVDKKVSSS